MSSITRRDFMKSVAAAGVAVAGQPFGALGAFASATTVLRGDVSYPDGFTVPAGEVWEFDPTTSTTVTVGANVVVYGVLRMRPASPTVIHRLRFTGVDESSFVGGGLEVLDTDVGLWVMGAGRLDLQGTPKRAWTRTGWDPSWNDIDDVRIAPFAVGDFGSDGFRRYTRGQSVPSAVVRMPGRLPRLAGRNRYETAALVARDGFGSGVRRVYVATGLDFPDALAGAAVAGALGAPLLLTDRGTLPGATRDALAALDPSEIVVLGGTAAISPGVEGAIGAVVPEATTSEDRVLAPEILNLTRNVKIEGTPAGRAHVLIRSSSPQTVRYVEIRNMGARRPEGGFTEGVLGRYGLHFHRCGDGSRGSLVEGVVVAEAGNHAFVPHASHGITFRDCIAYDVFEDAFWWDVKDRTDDLVWESCVAALVREDPDFRGFRLAGFLLGHGDRLTVTGCVAVAVQGTKTAAGFAWPEFTGGARDEDGDLLEGIWEFTDNISHNNRVDGVFTWQNTPEPGHIVSDSVFYRNGQAGIEHGAYINRYKYRRLVLWQNGLASDTMGAQIIQHAQGDGLEFSDIVTAGGPRSVLAVAHRGGPARTRYLRNSFGDRTAVVIREFEGSQGFEPGWYDFVDCGVEPDDVVIESAVRGMSLRSQNGSSAFEITYDGEVRTIPPFA